MVKTSDIKPQTLGERLKKGFDKFVDKLAADKTPESKAREANDAKVNEEMARRETDAQIKEAAKRKDCIDR